MQVDFSKIDTIESAKRVDEAFGTAIDIRFKNGATLRIGVENDVVIYFQPGNESLQTLDTKADAVLFANFGAGMHDTNQGHAYAECGAEILGGG
jgi:hypothetical protein